MAPLFLLSIRPAISGGLPGAQEKANAEFELREAITSKLPKLREREEEVPIYLQKAQQGKDAATKRAAEAAAKAEASAFPDAATFSQKHSCRCCCPAQRAHPSASVC